MTLYEAADGSRWWICDYFEDCGFCYPADWQEGEARLEDLVGVRKRFLTNLVGTTRGEEA